MKGDGERYGPRRTGDRPGPAAGFHVVVLGCGDTAFEVARRLHDVTGVARVTLVTAPWTRKVPSLGTKIRRLIDREGWGGLARAVLRRAIGGKATPDGPPTPALPPGIRHLTFDDFHGADCVAALRGLRPDLGVLAGTYILRDEVFELPAGGSINLHCGKAPEYRGAAPGFWELYNGESSVGVTIHRVTSELDGGDILAQELFPLDPAPGSDPMEYLEELRGEVLLPNGIRMLAESVARLAAGTARGEPQRASGAKTYRSPKHGDVQELRRRVEVRRRDLDGGGPAATDWRRRLKTFLGMALFRSGAHRIFFRGKALIVLFHRVDDRYDRGHISCSVRQFDAFCAFFRRYFVVVGLEELLDKLERGESVSRHLVITFDDGYRDNHDSAAAVLARHGLQACFFVATGLVGSERVVWWDEDAGIVSKWMDWDQVRSLRAQGFEVGAHTVNHVDLGVVEGDEAVAEVVESGRRLEAELDEEVRLFSYPYGRREQMTEENREIVRRAGYRCCLSAYGGIVDGTSDPYHLERVPISPWYASPYQFGLEWLVLSRGRS